MATYFDDFAHAVTTYPVTSVVLSIIDVVPQAPSTPGVVNVNEVWKFKVRVSNTGQLNLTGVSLHVVGQSGAQVSANGAAGTWTSLITIGNLTINGMGSQDTVDIFFKAPSGVKPPNTPLVSTHINTFDVNLNRILIDLTGHADSPAGTYSNQVWP